MPTIYEAASHFYKKHKTFLNAHYLGFSLRRMLFDIEDIIGFKGFSPWSPLSTRPQMDAITGYFDHLKTGAPVEYFTGVAHFYNHRYYVDKSVLIPRPETELLVEMALPYIREGHSVVDVGTGSGNIACTLAIECKKPISLVAVDRSQKALEIVKKNVFFNKFKMPKETKWRFLQSDRLGDFDGGADIILSNPPYLKRGADRRFVHDQVLKYEPWGALFLDDGCYDGWYRTFFTQIYQKLASGGIFIMEGHEDYLQSLRGLAEEVGFQEVEIHDDLARRRRFLRMVR